MNNETFNLNVKIGHTNNSIKIVNFCYNTDYFEFSKIFGDNKKLYETLKPIKQNGKITWKELKELKFSNIDFENNTITIEK